ncbi:MAG TPA: beta-phosphoglucomutase [Saprospiraceae bacterium]|nr:beta-phosphoglucomutase [Saprospiraceae bacterium]
MTSIKTDSYIFAARMERSIKALVFDLDGVIVDTAKYHFQSWREFAVNHGFSIPDRLNARLKGLSRMEALDEVMQFAPEELRNKGDFEAFAKEKNDIYLHHLTDLSHDEILPGVEKFLKDARQLGLKLALGSGSKNASSILARLDISHLFDAICDGNDIQRSKPDPQIFLLACERLGVDPRHAVVFEDAEVGIEAAENGNMLPVGVGDPSQLPHAAIVIDGFAYLHAAEFIRTLEQIHVS